MSVGFHIKKKIEITWTDPLKSNTKFEMKRNERNKSYHFNI